MSRLPSYREISCAEVQSKIEGSEAVSLVDVRQPWEYERAHISGVLLIPTDEFAVRCEAELDPSAEIICICEHGIRSKAAAAYLAGLGYLYASTMTGGMASYSGPVETSTTQ
jgi:rhodanese-related sulfurtransferase